MGFLYFVLFMINLNYIFIEALELNISVIGMLSAIFLHIMMCRKTPEILQNVATFFAMTLFLLMCCAMPVNTLGYIIMMVYMLCIIIPIIIEEERK